MNRARIARAKKSLPENPGGSNRNLVQNTYRGGLHLRNDVKLPKRIPCGTAPPRGLAFDCPWAERIGVAAVLMLSPSLIGPCHVNVYVRWLAAEADHALLVAPGESWFNRARGRGHELSRVT